MTAIIHPTTPIEAHPSDALVPSLAGLDDFLRDPIGYGDYDFADPLTLDEFSTCRHLRGVYVVALP